MDFLPTQRGLKRAMFVAGAIEERVSNEGWAIGTYLDDEVTLREKHHVGRSVFRQAIRVLEHLGVVAMRRGRGGGLVVGEPSSAPSSLAIRIGWSKAGAEASDIDHLVEVVRAWSSTGTPGRRLIADTVSAAAMENSAPLRLSDRRDQKAGERLAGEILSNMRELNWAEGHLLGSETELMESHNVGREALREAVQLLEFHEAARMQRGPGGGLLVENLRSGSALAASLRVQLLAHGIAPEEMRILATDLIRTLDDPTGVFGDVDCATTLRLAAAELAQAPAANVDTTTSEPPVPAKPSLSFS